MLMRWLLQHATDRLGFFLAGALGMTLIAAIAGAAGAGPLDPDDPPASTDSVRLPGTPITSLPYTITAPGHYYLTRNLAAAGTNGITLSARDVSIDLGGFTMSGTEDTFTVGVISTLTGSTRYRIYNGTIRDFQYGILLASTSHNDISDITVTSNTFTGVGLGANSTISDCMITKNARGISLDGSLTTVRGCVVSQNGIVGIQTDLFESQLIERTAVYANNQLQDPFGGGMMLRAANIVVRESEILNNAGRDVNVENANNIFLDNVVTSTCSIQPQPPGATNTYAPMNTADPHTNRSHLSICV